MKPSTSVIMYASSIADLEHVCDTILLQVNHIDGMPTLITLEEATQDQLANGMILVWMNDESYEAIIDPDLTIRNARNAQKGNT